ncbi:LOW QUALITY PROTEIN: Fc receptor-like protein 5 [Poeciliopsis prolifica]|uniref:LOW QUALITY PROTEIN: Fc receptor-like protein 5 n=1 Tax=Poeciliopsis prolifica TaxID=188132 RepID=UPI0024141688|nr:LOW QUALITY PROTEIN: Fc receptor-like protein 5 [Poeciliopsis prolifica]
MHEVSLLAAIFLTSLKCCSAIQASLTVDPSSAQIFEGEPLRLSCDDDISSSTGWILKRNTSNEHMTECGVKWGRRTGAACRISLTVSWDSGLYWCQSTEGVISSRVNLTVTGGSVILQSPALPVMEGDDVTLSCRARSNPQLPAAFYKDGSFIGDGSAGSMTLLHVSSSDEGLYKCSISGSGESPSSRVSVKASASAPPAAEEGLHLVYHVPLHLLVLCPYLICSALLVSVCRSRTAGAPGLDDEYDDVATPVTTEHHF